MTTNTTTTNIHTPKSMQELQSQRKTLSDTVRDIQQKVAFWHRAYLMTGGLAVIIAALTLAFQQTETRRTNALDQTRDSFSSISDQIHDLQLQAETTARRGLEKRTLSQEQFHTISETLRSFPQRTAQVICPAGNEEAYGFAKELSRVLESAHWRTGAGTVQMPNAPQDTGVTLFVRESESEGANQLRDALGKAGIRSTINVRTPLPGIIKVYVGPRP